MLRNYLTRKKAHTDSEIDINLTPMLDVVFILLIFFIVTASFVNETGINITPARATSATPQQATLQIGIDRHGDITVDNRTIDIRTLQNMLNSIYLQNPQSSVIIVADKASNNASLVKVLDSISRAGIENIAIAAEVDE